MYVQVEELSGGFACQVWFVQLPNNFQVGGESSSVMKVSMSQEMADKLDGTAKCFLAAFGGTRVRGSVQTVTIGL